MPRPKILIVDDDTETAGLLAELLALSGCLARTASDGIEALALAGDDVPNVVLLDVCLPRIDGCETARRFRRDRRFDRTRLIAFSGAAPGPWTALFDSHLSKPCTFGEVEVALALDSFAR